MNYELKHGQALVITGPQGSGKTLLARKIAAAYGPFVEIGVAQLIESFGISRAMDSGPRTLIVDGLPSGELEANYIKALITSDTVCVNRKNNMPRVVETPNFIFCSGDPSPIPLLNGDRRFMVVNIEDANRVQA